MGWQGEGLELAAPEVELERLLRGAYPDARGRFGPFGGRFVPETLWGAITRLESVARAALVDPAFIAELTHQQRVWVGRPTPLMRAENLSRAWNAEVWLKREDLAHTGAHKINNALGQALVAKRLGVSRIIAETGAGQHGVATAAVCARLGFPCRVYMGAKDVERQQPNVQRMKWFGAEVIAVTSGEATLRSAIDEALREWVGDPLGTHYLLGSAVGPHPFPWLVRTFQSVIGRESREQMLSPSGAGSLPDAVFSCVGGGSNAIGMFHGFLGDRSVQIIGAEAGGTGDAPGLHSATMAQGRPGVLHGSYSLLIQDSGGQVGKTSSISAGLDYPGVGPEHSFLHAIGRVKYLPVRDSAALDAVREMCRLEGILPAMEPSHAVAAAKAWCAANPGQRVLINLCGRGDKDMPILMRNM
jgi:tryptophan synthase beta chain